MTDQILFFTFDGERGQRLDKYLVSCLPGLSRSRIQGLLEDGFVRVGDKAASKAGMQLLGGEVIEVHIPPPEPADLVAEQIPLDVIFENEDLILVNKPAGMVVHPAAGHYSGTLVNAALAHAPEIEGIGGEKRPGIVHRLDKETSGLIILAKNDLAHRWLQDQFRLRKVEKVYLALVDGHPPTPQGRIEAPLGRDPSHRKQMAVLPPGKGRQAITEYKTLDTFPNHTLLEVHPYTGRTHQIRLHMAFIGCPVVGDTLYGRRAKTCLLDRHFLHAFRLRIVLPGESQPRVFEAAIPPELQKILDELQLKSK